MYYDPSDPDPQRNAPYDRVSAIYTMFQASLPSRLFLDKKKNNLQKVT